MDILRPIKTRINESPYFKNLNIFLISCNKKYSGLIPITAIMLEVQTINTSWVIPKIVGIESTANTISVLAKTTTTKNIGVNTLTPLTVVLNLDPSKSLLIFINLLEILKKKLFSGFESSSLTNAIFIPEGFAHGFQTLEDNCELLYMHSNNYEPSYEKGVRWNDPIINIAWPLDLTNLSERDFSLPYFVEL